MASSSTSRKRVIAALVAVPLILCASGAFFLATKIDYFQESLKLDDMMAQAKADGLPMTREEVEPEVVPDDLNAQFVYQDLLRNWPESAPQTRVNAQFRDLVNSTSRYPEFDAMIARLEKRPLLKLNKDWDMGSYVLFPELAQAKQLAKIISLQAVAEAKKGNAAFVRRRIQLLYTMSDQHRTRPLIIPYLVGIAIRSFADNTAVQCVVASKADQAVVRAARSALEEPRAKLDLTKPLAGEYYMGLSLMRNIRSSRSAGSEEDADKVPAWTKNPRRTGNPLYMTMRGSLAAFTHHVLEYRRLIRQNPDAKDLGKRLDAAEEAIPYTAANIMTAILLPVYGTGVNANRRSDVRSRIADQAIHLYLWCQANKRVPKSAAEAGLSFLDPYSNKPLSIYEKNGTVTLYCLGENGKDEGGPPTAGRKSDDFGFAFKL